MFSITFQYSVKKSKAVTKYGQLILTKLTTEDFKEIPLIF